MSATHYPSFDLTGKSPASTYTTLLQSNTESSSFVDGLGFEVGVVNLTASNAYQAVSASWAPASGNVATSSVAQNVLSPTQVLIRSGDSIVATCPNNMNLAPTGALFLEATTGDITLSPRTNVNVQGNLVANNSVSASSFYLLGAVHSGALVNDALGVISSQAALTTTIHLASGSSVTTMSFVNGILVATS